MRRTIVGERHLEGIGLHSGRPSSLQVRSGAPGSGIVFRVPMGDGLSEIPGCLDSVVDQRNATSLGRGGVRVGTVEHFLACVSMLGLDDLIIDVEGGEPPAADGSAAPILEALEAGETRVAAGARPEIELREEVVLKDGAVEVSAAPASTLSVEYTVDFEAKAIGRQTISFSKLDFQTFKEEVAPARTFGFLSDLKSLRAAGLAGGASLENVLVIDGDRIVNDSGLRWPDEFVRHKVLDLIGDLALLGAPLRAHLRVVRGGHAAHHAWMRTLRDRPSAWGWV
ncbi:MAG: UDP-3-O-acyl-N-acetylglucosamine deacetylase [Myxococcota bacterium]|nr:UDP-3-O-acyl-N-acetylglucosamine deacetylase [Myxococcota bacterium]